MKEYELAVIGAGAAGLVIAKGFAAAKRGKVILIEKNVFGGDCTNFGCIPSKALIASAFAAHAINTAKDFGIEIESKQFLAQNALKRTRHLVESVRREEEPKALHGIETRLGTARFLDPHTILITLSNGKEETIRAKKCAICTGSQPRIPNIPGLASIPFLTNETIFSLEKIPPHLGILGGGPIGCELAQAFRRLGSHVSLVQHGKALLKREDPSIQNLLQDIFLQEGISLHLQAELKSVEKKNDAIELRMQDKAILVSHLLIATGRTPALKDLACKTIDLKTTKNGLIVDAFGRTNHAHIFAAGDIVGQGLFTHVAEHQARAVLQNLILPRPFWKKFDLTPTPRVTYTDPEIASIGLKQEEAHEKYGKKRCATYTVPLKHVDRARTDGKTQGFVQIVTKKWTSRILGAHLITPRAGELLLPLSLAMKKGIPLRKLSSIIHPYPGYGLALRQAADLWLKETILLKVFR